MSSRVICERKGNLAELLADTGAASGMFASLTSVVAPSLIAKQAKP